MLQLTLNSELPALVTRPFSLGLAPSIRTICHSHLGLGKKEICIWSSESTRFLSNPILLASELCHWTFSITMNQFQWGREGGRRLEATVFYLGNIIQTFTPRGILFLLMGILVLKRVMTDIQLLRLKASVFQQGTGAADFCTASRQRATIFGCKRGTVSQFLTWAKWDLRLSFAVRHFLYGTREWNLDTVLHFMFIYLLIPHNHFQENRKRGHVMSSPENKHVLSCLFAQIILPKFWSFWGETEINNLNFMQCIKRQLPCPAKQLVQCFCYDIWCPLPLLVMWHKNWKTAEQRDAHVCSWRRTQKTSEQQLLLSAPSQPCHLPFFSLPCRACLGDVDK